MNDIGWKKRFFTIMSGQAVSFIGSSAVQFALLWWLATETGSPMMMAFSALFMFLPQIVFGPFVGVWLDRLHRKTVIICADLFMGVVALLFAAYFAAGNPPYWSVCFVLGIRAVGEVFHGPAMQAAVPMLVPKEELIRANGWGQFLQSGAFMLGPVLGALMYQVLPMPWILATDFVGAAVASTAVFLVPIPDPEKGEAAERHFFLEMKEGAKILYKEKTLWIATLMSTACMVFFMPLSSFYPLMTSEYFQASAWHASLVELLFAAGMMGSAFVLGMLGRGKRKILMMQMGLLGMGVCSLVCGLLPPEMWGFWVFAVCCFLLGAGSNVYNIPFTASLQEQIPHEAQGRVFSLITSLLSLTMPVGLVISGPYAEKHGVDNWFFVTGAAFIIIVVISFYFLKRENGKEALPQE